MKRKHLTRTAALLLLICLCLGLCQVPARAQEETSISVVSPMGYCTIEPIAQAPRLDTLAGKKIAIVGRSFNATTTQTVLKECLLEDYPDATIYTVSDLGCGGVFSVFHQSKQSKQFQQRLLDYGIDAVISGNCGCGLCTVKEAGSAIAAEYIGIPTVTVGATTFIPEIHSTGVNRGVPVLRTAEYPGAFSADTKEELKRKTREIIYPLVVEALTTSITEQEIAQYAGEGYRNYDDVLVSGSYDMLQAYFKECGYTDGLPVNLPTKAKVEEYLQYTPYEGSDILGSLPVAYRECRVYTVAVNAIMAGCPAEYMPLCVAFAKSMADGEWRRPLSSTHGWSPYAWLNGPVARQLGIDCGQGMISETNNQAFARFIELAMMNLGGYYIKENRMGTFGYLSPWSFAEDEEACLRVGWDPYHVTQGYRLNDNVLTAASALAWGNNVTPATPDAQQTMTLMAWDITEKEQNGLGNTNPQVYRTIFITEPVAENLSTVYKTKDMLEDALVETARRPLWLRVYANYWANTGSYQYTRRSIQEHFDMLLADEEEKAAYTSVPAWLEPILPDVTELLTVATMLKGQTPMLICGDSTRNKFQVMPGGGYVSVEIELPYNWDELMENKGYEPLSSFYLEEEAVLTGPVSVPEQLTDGMYRILPSEARLTAEGRFYYDGVAGLLKYWAWGAAEAQELMLDPESDFAAVLSSIGTSGNITVTGGVIADYVLRPPAAGRVTTTDASALTAEAFRGAGLTLAATVEQNAASGGTTPDGTSLKLDASVASFTIDLGGELYMDQSSTEGFVTFRDGLFVLDTTLAPGSVAKIGAELLDAPGTYRTFTITMGRGDFTVLYTCSDTMSEPVAVAELPSCRHDYQWVIDSEASCVAEGQKHEECLLCGEQKEPVIIELQSCSYNPDTHCCDICGERDPEYREVFVSVEVVREKKWGFLTNYTATISAVGDGVDIALIEYSTNGGQWTAGTTYSSRSPINTLWVRVTDSAGEITNWLYQNGAVSRQ